MRAKLAPALSAGAVTEIVPELKALAAMAPAGYDEWSTMAMRAAAAAERGSVVDVRAECVDCHGKYRRLYRAERRRNPLPVTMVGGL